MTTWNSQLADEQLHRAGEFRSESPYAGVSAMRRRLILAMACSDMLALILAFIAAAAIASTIHAHVFSTDFNAAAFLSARALDAAILIGLTIGVFAFGGLYQRGAWELEEVKLIVSGIALVALFDASLQYLQKEHFSRLWFVFAWTLAPIAIIVARMILRNVPALQHAMCAHVLLIGSGISASHFVADARESRSGAIRILRTLSVPQIAGFTAEQIRDFLEQTAAHHEIHPSRIELVLVPDGEERPKIRNLIETLLSMNLPFSLVEDFRGITKRGLRLHNVIGADLLVAEAPACGSRRLERLLKRVIDIVLAALLIVILSPLLFLISVLLVLEGGSVVFRQRRVGLGGSRFWCLKFRTMLPDAEARLQNVLRGDADAAEEWRKFQKLSNDPRITPLGRLLRVTSLDELPQLFNVIIGDMSLVGPRPIVAPEVRGYDNDHAYLRSKNAKHYCRFRPGITGLWQVSGRAHTQHDERVRLDAWYARNWSIWLDLVILLKTFHAVVARTGQ